MHSLIIIIYILDAGRGEATIVTKEEVGDAEVGVSIATEQR